MKKYRYITWLLCLLLVSCSLYDDRVDNEDDTIELSMQINSFVKGVLLSAETDLGSADEQAIDNLYVFLFPTSGSQTLKKYYVQASTFTGGSWSSADRKLVLDISKTEAGSRDVYVVANCADLKTALDGVGTLAQLQAVMQTSNTPWSAVLKTPILMSGGKLHDFSSNYQLNGIPLVRAVAKVQLNIALSASHQSVPLVDGVARYQYKYINFDKNMYVIKPSVKTDNLVSSSTWNAWTATGTVTSYTLVGGKVTGLTLTTYLNERDAAGSAIEISLPFMGSGPLPPPEFGDESYTLKLPAKVERNHWYIYDVAI